MRKFEINEQQLATVIEMLSAASHARPFNQVASVIAGLQRLPKIDDQASQDGPYSADHPNQSGAQSTEAPAARQSKRK